QWHGAVRGSASKSDPNCHRSPMVIVPLLFQRDAQLCATLLARGRRMNQTQEDTISFDDFLKVDVRVGRIVDVRPFPAARKPAYQLEVDFGPAIGRRRSSAQLTQHYQAEELIGRQVLAVVNFPPRQIATFFSEVLVLGVP